MLTSQKTLWISIPETVRLRMSASCCININYIIIIYLRHSVT
jgi:hypothetical protein